MFSRFTFFNLISANQTGDDLVIMRKTEKTGEGNKPIHTLHINTQLNPIEKLLDPVYTSTDPNVSVPKLGSDLVGSDSKSPVNRCIGSKLVQIGNEAGKLMNWRLFKHASLIFP